MLSHILKAGDRVAMKMDQESRSWGTKGVPDGTRGTITGRYRSHGIIENRYPRSHFREAGVYSRDTTILVEWDDYSQGGHYGDPDYDRVSSSDLIPIEGFIVEYEARSKELWPVRLPNGEYNPDFCIIKRGYELDNLERTGDLPETTFWEQDLVTDTNDLSGQLYRIVRINYNTWGPTKLHCYDMREVDKDGRDLRSGQLSINPTDLKLYERGNVWRELHGEKPVFRDIEDEADHERGMGRYNEVRNPDTLVYSWTIEEAFKALNAGTIDIATMSGSPFSPFANRSVSAVKFTNEEFSDRIRNHVLTKWCQDVKDDYNGRS